jgi:hypothetical protein
MDFVNSLGIALSVVGMVQWVLKVPRGAWLLQSAAASALGRMVSKIGGGGIAVTGVPLEAFPYDLFQ